MTMRYTVRIANMVDLWVLFRIQVVEKYVKVEFSTSFTLFFSWLPYLHAIFAKKADYEEIDFHSLLFYVFCGFIFHGSDSLC